MAGARGASKGTKPHIYTEAQYTFLRLECELPRTELTAAFNARFGTNLSVSAIKGTCKRHGWLTGRTGKFQKGHVPSPKAINTKPNRTSFKKGHKPHNWRPVGSERDVGGYLYVKLTDTGSRHDWHLKHHLVWKESNGEIPEHSKVVFRDNNPHNCDIENLMLVSNAEMAVINKSGHGAVEPELKETVVLMAQLKIKQRSVEKSRPSPSAGV